MSDDGRYVSFHSSAAMVPGDTNGLHDVYRRDLVARTTARASVPNGGGEYDQVASGADMSNDGRYVLFLLREAGFADGGLGIVADMATNTTTTVTLRSVTDVVSPTTVADPPDIPMPVWVYRFAGYSPELALSGDGRFALWGTAAEAPGDTNGGLDVYRRWWRP